MDGIVQYKATIEVKIKESVKSKKEKENNCGYLILNLKFT